MDRRKELKLAYKENPPAMGVYQIKNTANGKILVGQSANLKGSRNSYKFQLQFKYHHNKPLQEDLDRYGYDTFAFEVLETLKSDEIPEDKRQEALIAMEEKWLSVLQPYGPRGYNKEGKGRQK